MKKRKLAMLLALTLTCTQVASVPAAAEALTMDVFQTQNDSAVDDTTESEDEWIVAVDEELSSLDDAEVTADTAADTIWEQGAEQGDSAADDTLESNEDLSVEEDEEIIIENEAAWDENVEFDVQNAGTAAMLELFSESSYELGIEYRNGHNMDTMLPNSTMRISTYLDEWLSENESRGVEDYEVQVQIDENDAGKFSATVEDDTQIVIRSTNATDSFEFRVKALVDGEEVCTNTIGFNVNTYVIESDTMDDEDNPALDEEFDIFAKLNPVLCRYDENMGHTVQVDSDDYQIMISYWEDEEGTHYQYAGWDWIGGEGNTDLILKRNSQDSAYFCLCAVMEDENGDKQVVAESRYNFDSLYDDEEGDGDGDGDDDGDIFHDRTEEMESGYELAIEFSGSGSVGNGAMLPESTMTVVTELYDLSNTEYGVVEDYKLEIVTQSKFGYAEVSENGKNLIIESYEQTGDGCCVYVSVSIPNEDGDYQEIFKRDISFSVTNYCITPQTLTDANGNPLNPKEGEELDLSKLGFQLQEYRSGKGLVTVDDPAIKIIIASGEGDGGEYVWDYDDDGWDWISEPDVDLPILKRKTSDATWFAVSAAAKNEDQQWEILTRKDFYFDSVEEPHTHEWTSGKVTKNATCTGTGLRIDTCTCGGTKEVVIPAKGHTEVKDAAVAATAVTTGKTAGSHCSVCGTVLKKQTTVAKLKGTITLTASSLKMKTGQSTTAFKASGFAKGDYVTKVTSDKTSIVTVKNVKKDGIFTLTAGKKTGTAEVTVYLASGTSKSFKVTVQKGTVKTTKITTTSKSLTLTKGAAYKKLASSITVAPVTSTQKITYSSSNKKVATVSSAGVITAKKAGTAKITAKSGSKKVVVTVTVTGIKTTKLSGVPKTKTIAKGKKFTIKATATPKNTDEKITYKTSDKKVATVTSKGVVKGVGKGTATITVQSGSKKLTCKVTVK